MIGSSPQSTCSFTVVTAALAELLNGFDFENKLARNSIQTIDQYNVIESNTRSNN